MKVLALLALVPVACDDLKDFGGPVPAYATVKLEVTGDPTLLPADADLKVAMVWGGQWLVEALCILPPENMDAATLLAAGCRDPFGFVPARVDSNVPAAVGVATTLPLIALPSADLLIGDVTARVGYASLIVYDDRDHNGTLTLARPNRIPSNGPGMGGGSGSGDLPVDQRDTVYGASFAAMTQPDQRVAYREGEFSPVAAFYPRAGCGDPPLGFSMLAAGGFTAQAAIEATLANMLPQEDPASCAETVLSATTIEVPLQMPVLESVKELGCAERTSDSSVRYLNPDPTQPAPDFTDRVTACVHLPSFGAPSDTVELVVSGRSEDACVGISHYVLKGCRESPDCGSPDWDHSGAPPTWWPCGP
ncbi:MAG TPA: hypothetical protein VFQ65_11340 [Kofleriaceae bacterium]|nr:hypothetical protein [Kofleriaceae bacterium]